MEFGYFMITLNVASLLNKNGYLINQCKIKHILILRVHSEPKEY